MDKLVSVRLEAGIETWMVSIHSFTPVYKRLRRPWHVGIIHDEDRRLAGPLLDALRQAPGLVVGKNEPYSPADRVYFTLERHGRAHGLPCAMIEIRNDEILDAEGQRKWANLLAGILAHVQLSSEPAADPEPISFT